MSRGLPGLFLPPLAPAAKPVCARTTGRGLVWVAALWVSVIRLQAGDQPQFGQAWSRNMVSGEKDLPTEIDPASGKNVKWSVPLGTESYATPVVSQGRIYVGTNNGEPRDARRAGDRGVLLCLDERDGRLLWQLAVPKREEDPYYDWPKTGMSSPVTVEGDRVYLVDNRGVVLCLDAHGLTNGNQGPFQNEAAYFTPRGTNAVPPPPEAELGPLDADILWQFDLTKQAGIWSHDGAHSSILIHGNHLYLNTGTGVDNTHKKIRTPDAPSLVVLDKRTGEWLAQDGLGIASRIFHCTWSSPSLAKVDGRELILFAGGDGVLYAFEPLLPANAVAERTESGFPQRGTGPRFLRRVWQFDFDPAAPKDNIHQYNGNRAVSPSNIYGMPVYYDGRVYIAGGGDWFWGKNEAWLKCLDPRGSGDLTATALKWELPVGRHTMSTPAIQDGLAVVGDSMHEIHVADAVTGKSLWAHDVGGELWASALIADGKVYVGTRRGLLWVFALAREKKVLGQVQLDGPISATPVAANGTLYIGTQTRLYAFKAGAQNPSR